MRAESPGPEVGKLAPKMRKTAVILYAIYCVMTVVQMGLLLHNRRDLEKGVM